MKYELTFLSGNGGVARIAHAIAEILPERETQVVDLSVQKKPGNAEIYLIGFDLHRETCPYAVLDAVEGLEGKRVLLFASSGFGAGEKIRERIENQLMPFLPERCHYLGLHLCRGRLTEEDLSCFVQQAEQQGGRINQNPMKAMYEESQSHPDVMDLRGAVQFVRSRLNL